MFSLYSRVLTLKTYFHVLFITFNLTDDIKGAGGGGGGGSDVDFHFFLLFLIEENASYQELFTE